MGKCAGVGCTLRSTFGVTGTTITLYCKKHAMAGMTDVNNRLCAHLGCNKHPSFGSPGYPARYCKDHAEPGMVNRVTRKCAHRGCAVSPSYGVPGTKKAIYCSAHATAGTINVRAHRCMHPGCATISSYGVIGTSRAMYCRKHATDGMIHVRCTLCEYAGCKKCPVYNNPDVKGGRFCKSHKLDGMINVVGARCAYEHCCKKPSYGQPGTTAARCKAHAEPGMVNVVARKCAEPGCCIIPAFGTPGSSRTYCKVHARPDMINIYNRICTHSGCSVGATYGPLFGLTIHCAAHRTPADFRDRDPKCVHDGCGSRPTHAGVGSKINYPEYCGVHAPNGAREVVGAVCAKCHGDSIVSVASMMCDVCEFGTVHGSYHKFKEQLTADAIRAIPSLHAMLTSRDHFLADGPVCGVKRRPDFLFDRPTYALILEVDENAHAREYIHADKGESSAGARPIHTCECECARMVEIQQTIGAPTVFIRFNPDGYADANGHKHKRDMKRYSLVAEYVFRVITTLDSRVARGFPAIPLGLYAEYMYYDHSPGVPIRCRIDYVAERVEPWNYDD